MQPPNLQLVPWIHGEMCTTCKFFELRTGKYWCTKYDLNVRHNDLCNEYQSDGKTRVC
jgi:hypothetical protein